MKKLFVISGIVLVVAFVVLTILPVKKTESPKISEPQQALEKGPQKTPEEIIKKKKKKTPAPVFEHRAVSLKILQQKARECMAKGKCPENILKLCGLTKVNGFVIDEKNRDIILFGKVDSTSPALYLEDFVIALRNAWWKYAPLKGYTYYYSAPGCSIDPNPKTIQKLQQVGGKILSTSGEVESSLKQWHAICSQPQKVRVLGIPFDSRFAKVMVDADYYMKELVDGSVSSEIPGFISLTDMTLAKVKKDVVQRRPISVPFLCMNRFWFFPGKNQYLEDKGVVFIKQCQVKLLTEEEFLTKRGEIAGKGRPNPLAQKFAEDFTAQYEEIAKRKPIYTELKNLFRFVALAKIMKYKDIPAEAQLDFNYFLSHCPLSRTPVSRTLPGLSHVKGFQHRQDFPGGYQIAQLWLPSCGGVAIDIRISKENFVKDETKALLELKKAILKTRPSPDALYWDFQAATKWIVKLKNMDKHLVS